MQSRLAVRGIVALALVTGCATSCANSRGGPDAPSTDVAIAALVAPPPPADPPAPPPFELTSSDGVGLRIASVRASAVIDDPLALTELHLVFQNAEPRRIEGRFTLALPPGASLGRFAMKVGGVLQEGEIVEKQEARLTYEEYLHVRRDPALLEQGAANEVAVRVFPIEPGELKEIVVTYSEALDGAHPYRLRLAGLPTIGELSASAYVAGEEVATASLHEERPAGDLVVDAARWKTGVVSGLAGGRDVAIRVPVPGASTPEPEADAVVALVDTSASRSLDLVRELDTLARRTAALPAATRLVVIAYDQEATVVFDGAAGAFDDAARAKLGARHALGATDLAGALRFASTIPPRAPGERRRLFLFGDGVATAGPHEPRDLAEATAALSLAGFSRADAIAVGGLRDDVALGSIVRGAHSSSGVVVSADEDESIVAKRLETTTIDPASVTVAGASFVHPTRVVGAQPGDDVIIHASFAANAAPSTVTVAVGNVKRDVALRAAPSPFVARSVAAERIARLESDPDLAESAKRSQVVDLAKKYRVESAYTGMLVLEDDAAYERHHIDRKSKLDVLGIRDGAVAVTSTARPTLGVPATPGVGHDPATISAPPPASPPSSSPAPSARPSSHVSRPPAIRMGATMVSGRLPPEVVQRIVRLGFGRFRGCYQAALVGHPTLSGRATMSFLIALDGSVASVAASSSDLPESVRACLARAFASLTFPPPEGGVVRVTYPLVFTPEGTTSQAPLSFDAFRPTRRLATSFSAAPDYHRVPLAVAGVAPLYDVALGGVMALVDAGRCA
ncbi:MAG TPA: VIT domain-containing protein, partial [Polyangiaceae bacterium]|nr:VIT domain-containing protein [Polyangiaceae bacterium]